MKKEEICVLIDTPKKAKKAYKILNEAGEEMSVRTEEKLMNGKPSSSYIYLGFYSDDWVLLDRAKTLQDLTVISLKKLKKLLNPMPKQFAELETVTIQIPLKYATAFEIALEHLMGAEEKHPDFPYGYVEQFCILSEEVGEIAKDINNGNCHKSEVGDTLAVCLRMLV